jgi:hypothetical protein
MLAGLAGQASLNGRTNREATRLPVDEWFAGDLSSVKWISNKRP